jgi:hypothetical protein
MANLKFKDIGWDNNRNHTLMFVEFEHNGRILKWYPKWAETNILLHNVWATEDKFNKAKLLNYLKAQSLILLLRYLLIESNIGKSDWVKQLNNLQDSLSTKLIDKRE